MITIYKHSETGLLQMSEPIEGCWINVVDPTPDELKTLISYDLPHDYLTYPLDLDERARSERENGELLIILRIPFFQGQAADVPYATIPLGIILNNRYLVTVCRINHDILREFSSGHVKGLSTGKRQRFILRILLASANKFLSYLREINKVVDALEDQLQQSTRNKEVLELLKYQKSLTYFATALKSNELMMERLERSKLFQAFPEDEDLLDDVLTENQQAIEMTNISSNILSGMMDAFASIISNNLNAVMKFLAAITVVLSLPTMIASFYGMNVDLPLDHLPSAYIYPFLASVFIVAAVLFIFNRRDWL